MNSCSGGQLQGPQRNPCCNCIIRPQPRSVNSVTTTAENVKFKTIPFQRIIREVVPPMEISFAEIMFIAETKRTINNFGAEFYLSISDVQRICQPNIGPNDRKPTCQLQIRIGEKLPGMQELSEVLPRSIIMSINNKPIPMDDIKSPLNLNAIDYLYLNTVNVNSVGGIWPNYVKRKFYVVVYLVEKISAEELVNDMRTDTKRYFSEFHTQNIAKKLFGNSSNDASLENYKLTLLCPINKLKMELPSRSVNCIHIECFELKNFIFSNEIEPKWTCPICMKPCISDDLKIDSLVLYIIKRLDRPNSSIELHMRGELGQLQLYCRSDESILDKSDHHIQEAFTVTWNNKKKAGPNKIEKAVLATTSAGNSNNLKPNIYIGTTSSTKETDIDKKPPLLKMIKKEDTDK